MEIKKYEVSKENIQNIAKDLYEELKAYKNEVLKRQNRNEGSSINQNDHTLEISMEYCIYAKAKLLNNLGLLKEVFLEVEILDEVNNTHFTATLESLTLGLL